jgi:hypothetical protein
MCKVAMRCSSAWLRVVLCNALRLQLPDATLATDVSVINPVAESYVRAAARADGAAAEARDALKIRNYREGGDGGAYAIIPLSMETYGRLGKAAMQLLLTLAGIAADSGKLKKHGFVENTLRKLSLGLCRGNGTLFRAGLEAVAKASGRSFQKGLAEPTAEPI